MYEREESLPLVEDLRRAVREAGVSLSELGRQAGVSQPQLSRFVSGERTLTLPAAARVCLALGLRLVRDGGSRPGSADRPARTQAGRQAKPATPTPGTRRLRAAPGSAAENS
jgi:transcriptional regulator with XRE-family HTH domain